MGDTVFAGTGRDGGGFARQRCFETEHATMRAQHLLQRKTLFWRPTHDHGQPCATIILRQSLAYE